MKTKKIWFGAFTFGLIATVVLYFSFFAQENQSIPVSGAEKNNVAATEEKKSDVVEETTKEEEKAEGTSPEEPNKMLPVGEGKRAFSLALNEVQGVSGFVEPGSYIDIVSILTAPKEKAEGQHDAATLLLQNIRVLAVGHAADTKLESGRYTMITLEVTPHQGLALGFATKSDLYLMLRNDGDKSVDPEKTHLHEDDVHKGVFY